MEKTNNIFKNGSIWLKADFHLHSKADKKFKYDGEDNDFVGQYIEQLKKQNIGIGVITNHNKFDKEEFVSLKKKAKKENIGLFPGVEFSLKEGIHILIVFDEKWYQGETDNINEFLNRASFGINNFKTPPYPNSKLDLNQTVKTLDEIVHDYFIVLAHVDDRSGLFDVLSGRTLEAFIQSEGFEKVLAVQKSGNLDNYKRLCSLANRKLACVEGSDNAEGGIEAIGSGRITYAKIGDFNFGALKYVLTDHEDRIVAKNKPKIQNSYIKSIAFEDGLLDGKSIEFSSELNNIIGIRGSGKSSILEILRYTLNIPLGSNEADNKYKTGLINHVFTSNGKATINVVNNKGEEYSIRKIYGEKADIFRNGELVSKISIDAVLDRPLYFGQKDLSNKQFGFENDLINRLIESKLKDYRAEIDRNKVAVEHTIIEFKKLKDLKEKKRETESTLNDATFKYDEYKKSGVEEKLKLQTEFDRDLSRLNHIKDNLCLFDSELKTIIQEYLDFFNQQFSVSENNKELFEEAKKTFGKFKTDFKKIESIANESATNINEFEVTIKKLEEKKESLKEEFREIRQKINIPSLNTDEFIKLNRTIETSRLKLKEIKKAETKRTELLKKLDQNLVQLDNSWRNEYKLTQIEINRINDNSNKIYIKLEYKEERETFLKHLQQIFRGTNISGTAYKEISETYKDYIQIYKDNYAALSKILTEKQSVDFKQRFDEYLTKLLTFKVDNKVTFYYDDKPLKQHSLGQQASALILFLLARKENDILIIDQPEDDLDNQTIYEDVIKEIKSLKGNMQFIFATHNANIPVLGDSEKVVACTNNDNIEIELHSGTIDNHETQERIVNIMEGGKDAFRIRKNIYEIWSMKK